MTVINLSRFDSSEQLLGDSGVNINTEQCDAQPGETSRAELNGPFIMPEGAHNTFPSVLV